MASEVTAFVWTVPKAGYQWIQAPVFVNPGDAAPSVFRRESRLEDKSDWILTDGRTLGQLSVERQYSPLKEFTGLFRTFAQIPLDDREAMLAFANEYGSLGIPRPRPVYPEGDVQPGLFGGGEKFQDWVREIDAMQRAVAIWDMFLAGDRKTLSRYVTWHEAEYAEDGHTLMRMEGWIYDSRPDLPSPHGIDARKGIPPAPGRFQQLIPPVLELFDPGDVFAPASFLVQRWINEHLKGKVTPWLVYHPGQGKRVLELIPDNLLSAMWFQFAQGIAANKGFKDYRACKECGKWFELSHKQTDHRTARREFCSDPCKSKDYRRRKERARQLKGAGRTVKDIAGELNTDVETIKKWVAKQKGN